MYCTGTVCAKSVTTKCTVRLPGIALHAAIDDHAAEAEAAVRRLALPRPASGVKKEIRFSWNARQRERRGDADAGEHQSRPERIRCWRGVIDLPHRRLSTRLCAARRLAPRAAHRVRATRATQALTSTTASVIPYADHT